MNLIKNYESYSIYVYIFVIFSSLSNASYAKDECWNGANWVLVGREKIEKNFEKLNWIDVSKIEKRKDMDETIQYLTKLKEHLGKIKSGLNSEYKKGCNRWGDQLFNGAPYMGQPFPRKYSNLLAAIDDMHKSSIDKYNRLAGKINKNIVPQISNDAEPKKSLQSIQFDTKEFDKQFKESIRLLEYLNSNTPRLSVDVYSSGVQEINKLLAQRRTSPATIITATGNKESIVLTIEEELIHTLSWYGDTQKASDLATICSTKNNFEIFPSICTMKESFEKSYLKWSALVAGKNIDKIVPVSKLLDLRRQSYTLIERKQHEIAAQEYQEQITEYNQRKSHIIGLERELGKSSLTVTAVSANKFAKAIVERKVSDSEKGRFIAIPEKDSSYYVTQVLHNGALLEPTSKYDRDLPIIVITDDNVFKGDHIFRVGTVFTYSGLTKYETVLGASRQAILLVKLK